MAGFWEWRRGGQETSTTALAVEEAPLEPVELYTRSTMLFGLVESDGRRLSDILNSDSHLSLRDARSTSIIDGVDGVDGTEAGGWTSVSADDILLIMPPERISPRQMRVNRRQHRVRIATGPYQVIGNAHLPPGVGLDAYALQKRIRFLAVTKAVVYSTDDTALERMAQVVLVNIGPIVELTEVLTLS